MRKIILLLAVLTMTGCTTLMTPTSSTKVQIVKIKPPSYLLDAPIEPELVPDNSSFSDVMKVHKRNALAWKQARDQLNYLIRWSKEIQGGRDD